MKQMIVNRPARVYLIWNPDIAKRGTFGGTSTSLTHALDPGNTTVGNVSLDDARQ